MNPILFVIFLAITCAPVLRAQDSGVANGSDGVTIKEGKPYSIQGNNLELITRKLELPLNIVVTTNGDFTVGKGKERALSETIVVPGALVKY